MVTTYRSRFIDEDEDVFSFRFTRACNDQGNFCYFTFLIFRFYGRYMRIKRFDQPFIKKLCIRSHFFHFCNFIQIRRVRDNQDGNVNGQDIFVQMRFVDV